jgi:[ribosomal protein S5]-alanine N-acetyltransferase
MTIETKSLTLIACDKTILINAIEGNDKLGKLLNIKVEDNWTEFGLGPLQYSLGRLSEDIQEMGWLTYLPIKQDNKLIGSCGYKGKPTVNGSVEIGYEIAPGYRNKGLATEMTEGLISHAFANSSVKIIYAHTLRQENASTKILSKFGFVRIGEVNDPDDGLIWKWVLKKR